MDTDTKLFLDAFFKDIEVKRPEEDKPREPAVPLMPTMYPFANDKLALTHTLVLEEECIDQWRADILTRQLDQIKHLSLHSERSKNIAEVVYKIAAGLVLNFKPDTFVHIDPMVNENQIMYFPEKITKPSIDNEEEMMSMMDIRQEVIRVSERNFCSAITGALAERISENIWDDLEMIQRVTKELLYEANEELVRHLRHKVTLIHDTKDNIIDSIHKSFVGIINDYNEHPDWIIVGFNTIDLLTGNMKTASNTKELENFFMWNQRTPSIDDVRIQEMGCLVHHDQIPVYFSPFVKPNNYLMGTKTNKVLSAPMRYMPYIPLVPQGSSLDIDEYADVIRFKSREAWYHASTKDQAFRHVELI